MEREIYGMFATPVSHIKLSQSFSKEIKWLQSQEMRHTMSDVQGPHPDRHDVSKNSYILNDKKMKPVLEVIENEVTLFMKDVLSMAQPGRITQSWVNRNSPGEGTHQHAHPNSIVSGVWYFDMPDGKGNIRFHRHKADHGIFEMRPEVKFSDNMPYWAWDWHEVTPSTGDLVLFPSYLRHSVLPNPANKIRWSLAFNSVPQDYLGTLHDLTHFGY